jgi:hypothetical protein
MKLSGRIKHGQGGEIGGFPKEAKRPGKMSGRVANVVAPTPRDSSMPRPTKDTKPTKKAPGKYGR